MRGKFIAIYTYLKNTENIWVNNLTLRLQELEEQQETKSRASKRKELTKVRVALNYIETKKTIQRVNKSRRCFFEKINKINKPSTRLIKKKEREDPNKVRNERGEITIDTTGIQRIVRNYYKEIYMPRNMKLGWNRQVSRNIFLET